MNTWALYLDESGNVDRHDVPLGTGQTPVFSIAGLALPLGQWRDYDREYLSLKRNFFAKEIDASSKTDTKWEIKGNNLIAPRNKGSERNKNFTYKVLDLIKKYDGKVFALSTLKCSKKPTSKTTIYTKAIQIIDERYDVFLREKDADGIIILDSRMAHMKKGAGVDYTVATSHLSFIFGNKHGRELKRIKEAPLFADSCLTAGLQIADIIAALTYARCHYDKLSEDVGAAGHGFHDYSHTKIFSSLLRGLEFCSTNTYGGHRTYGTKILDHRNDKPSKQRLKNLENKFK